MINITMNKNEDLCFLFDYYEKKHFWMTLLICWDASGSVLQAQNLDLNNVTPIKIFELMFQSPENSISQDDPHPTSKISESKMCV